MRSIFQMLLIVMVAASAQLLVTSQTRAEPKSASYTEKHAEAAYQHFKSILLSEHVSAFGDADVRELQGGGAHVLIAPCAGGDFYAGYADDVKDPLAANLLVLATTYAFAETALRLSKYPEKLWKSPLKRAEKTALGKLLYSEDVYDDQTEWLAKNLNKAAKAKKLRLPPVTSDPECSVDYQTFQIRVEPSKARVLLIPKIFYRYCERVHINPLDRNACDFWLSPAKSGDDVNLAGVYMYRIDNSGKLSAPDEVDVDRYSGKLELPR